MNIIFRYHAKDANGVDRNGEIEAIDEQDAIKKLQAQGLFAVSVGKVEAKKPETTKAKTLNESTWYTSIIKILPWVILVFIVLLFNELKTNPDPNTLIFKKETISSWMPLIEKYYMYDKDGKRHKVSKSIYDDYWLWSEEKGIYANDRVAQAITNAVEKSEREARGVKKKQREQEQEESNFKIAQVLTLKGIEYNNKGDYDQAITELSNAIEIYPKYAEAYAMRGMAYFYKYDYDKCLADTYKAQELGYKYDPKMLENLKKLSEEASKKNTLDGIFVDEAGKYKAMINGVLVSEGCNKGGIKIDKINKESIDIIVSGQKKNIKVGEKY